MKKILLIIVILTLCATNNYINAQTDNDEITVTTKNGKKEVIELPEAMTIQLDSLLSLYHSQQYLQKDSDCNLPDYNPTYTKDEYIDRLKRLPTIMEMPYNDIVQKFIDQYSGQLRNRVSYLLGASNFYMPVFEQALEVYRLPLELKYLPVIESALNPNAVSRVGATGLWQFMLATGKRYGLEVNSLVDERRDIVKSSYAAAHYLSDLYKIFGDWNLVIAAYNAGPDKINKAIHRTGSKDYWEIYPYLPKETRGYVPAFIAANYIMNYYCEHNICPAKANLPIKTDTVIVNHNLHFEQISKVLGISVDEIKTLNPQYRQNIINGETKPSSLRLPEKLITLYIDNEDSVINYKTDSLLTKRSVVEVTDKISSLDYERKNYSRKQSKKNKYYSKPTTKNRRNKKRKGKSITIKNGDTLSEIAERNGTTVKKLRKLNGIKGNTIRKGKKIKVR